ncbi:MAG: ParA family protein, partial [Clostridia bacterium]|nr:ParA family protein [Clostridia bacterium]
MLDKGTNLIIVCGHYGSGKTNIAVNLAIRLREQNPGKKVYAADLDIVNPYFRTADAAELLAKNGIEALIPEFANTNVDIPSLPPKLYQLLEGRNEDEIAVIDVGGDDGSVALGMYQKLIRARKYEMIYVINYYRPLTEDPADCYGCMLEIEAASGLKCTGIVNNSNLGAETTEELITSSVEYAKKCAEACSLPLLCHSYCPAFAPDTP